jgi:hypothetical protein
VAGGARRVLASRGELRPGLVLMASVAASVRAAVSVGGGPGPEPAPDRERVDAADSGGDPG